MRLAAEPGHEKYINHENLLRFCGAAGDGRTWCCPDCFQHSDNFTCGNLRGFAASIRSAARARGAREPAAENRAASEAGAAAPKRARRRGGPRQRAANQI